MDNQSEHYIQNDADQWFKRNIVSKRNGATDYLLSLFSKESFAGFDIAEFGIGRGANLLYLSHFAKSVHGFDGSALAVNHFMDAAAMLLPKESFSAQIVNLCTPIEGALKLDLIVYGFFAYMVSDKELSDVKSNTDTMLKEGGYVFVYDFLSQSNIAKPDSHNSSFQVFKRNLAFWIDHFEDYVLMDFRLMDNERFKSYIRHDLPSHIDMECSMNDGDWAFMALFKKRDKQ